MLIETLKGIVGPNGWKTDCRTLEIHTTEWRGVAPGRTPIVLFPANVREVSAIVRACSKADVGIVPQGGNTGMCAGAVPDNSGSQIVLSLSRLDSIRSIDVENFSMEVEAGCSLSIVQAAAEREDRLFALSLGAEGSCQIGGNLATNAGGVNVLRYGTARAQVLGLEVVMADGTVVDSMRALRKDTAGYDLKQLFIGSEGTLGIITAATLKLFSRPAEIITALIAIPTAGHAVRLLADLRVKLADNIEAFELMSDDLFTLIEKHVPDSRLPFDQRAPWYVLMDASLGKNIDLLETALGAAAEAELLIDAVVAKNLAESKKLWRIRHSTAEAERAAGKAQKHDVSVPLSKMEEFLERGDALLQNMAPDAQLIAFGHVGDGNLHYNVALPNGFEDADAITDAIYDLVNDLGGSFSAEHGVGSVKRLYLPKYRNPAELKLMQTLKTALDPKNILNPGKVI